MKNKKLIVIFSAITLALALTGCQSSSQIPVDTVNKVVDSVFYMQDSDTAYENLLMDSAETRELFISLGEYSYQSQFLPESEDEEAAEGEEATAEEDNEEDLAEEDTAPEIHPNVTDSVRRIMSVMQDNVTYKTKIMTLSSTEASVKITVYPLDVYSEAFYTEYTNKTSAITVPEEDDSDEVWDEYMLQLLDAYTVTIESLGATSETGYDVYAYLYKSGDSWLLQGMESLFYDLYYLFMSDY